MFAAKSQPAPTLNNVSTWVHVLKHLSGWCFGVGFRLIRLLDDSRTAHETLVEEKTLLVMCLYPIS
jgi:hypothetical protein